MGTILTIVGLVVVAGIAFAFRDKIASLLRIGADKGYNSATSEADREKDKMNQAVGAETKAYNAAKAQLVSATSEVQTVLGQANTQKRLLTNADAALTKAKQDVKDAQGLGIAGDDLNQYLDKVTAAKTAYDQQVTRAQAAAKAAAGAQQRLETATAAVEKFADQIAQDKSDTSLATALNLTTNISRTTADLNSTLSASAEAHNTVSEALDRAQAGADMTAPKVDPLEEARKKREREAALAEANGTAAPSTTPPAGDATK
jgi:hypothetical protein